MTRPIATLGALFTVALQSHCDHSQANGRDGQSSRIASATATALAFRLQDRMPLAPDVALDGIANPSSISHVQVNGPFFDSRIVCHIVQR